MEIVLLVVANNRPEYLTRILVSIDKYLTAMPSHIQDDVDHQGMAVNIQAGWSHMLQWDWDFLLHMEDDMELLAPLPLYGAAEALCKRPHVANMIFQRQPWNDIEREAGGVHAAIKKLAPNYIDHGTWGEHDHIFSLNPCLIPRHIVERGWPKGNEAEMTAKLLADGYTFGIWGQPTDAPIIDHIGIERGPGWKL